MKTAIKLLFIMFYVFFIFFIVRITFSQNWLCCEEGHMVSVLPYIIYANRYLDEACSISLNGTSTYRIDKLPFTISTTTHYTLPSGTFTLYYLTYAFECPV